MAQIERWIVPLEGHSFDADDLPHWLAGGEVEAVVFEGETCLTFPAHGTESGEVLERAIQFLNLVNGAAVLLDPSYRPLVVVTKFYAVDSEGKKVGITIQPGTGEVRSKAGALSVSINGVPGRDPRKGAALPLLNGAKSSLAASDALTLVGRQRPTWSELAVVRELVLEQSGGKMIEQGWISEAADERFRRTANSRQVLGIEARHGHEKHSPPPIPMTYAEALRTIRTLVERWLRSLQPSAGD